MVYSIVYSIVCVMRSQVGVHHNHIGTTALCVGIYRSHTVYAVIANGRANNFVFPRSAHHVIRIHLQTDTRSSLLLFPNVFTGRRTLLSYFSFFTLLYFFRHRRRLYTIVFLAAARPIKYYIIIVVSRKIPK